jgi:hypothetical protein
MVDFYGKIQRIPEILLSKKLRRLIRYLRRINRWKKEHQETTIRMQDREGAMADVPCQEHSMSYKDDDLEVPWGLQLGIYQMGIPAT